MGYTGKGVRGGRLRDNPGEIPLEKKGGGGVVAEMLGKIEF